MPTDLHPNCVKPFAELRALLESLVLYALEDRKVEPLQMVAASHPTKDVRAVVFFAETAMVYGAKNRESDVEFAGLAKLIRETMEENQSETVLALLNLIRKHYPQFRWGIIIQTLPKLEAQVSSPRAWHREKKVTTKTTKKRQGSPSQGSD